MRACEENYVTLDQQLPILASLGLLGLFLPCLDRKVFHLPMESHGLDQFYVYFDDDEPLELLRKQEFWKVIAKSQAHI